MAPNVAETSARALAGAHTQTRFASSSCRNRPDPIGGRVPGYEATIWLD